jgi:hypothetical protein
VAYEFSLEDVAFLTSDAGAQALRAASGLALTDETLLSDLTRLRTPARGRPAPVAETMRLRRRAGSRWGAGFSEWLFTDEALQQASPPPVAGHRARRLAGHRVHDVTCSIGSDLAALAQQCPVAIGSDLDPVRLAMAAHNLAVSGLPVRLSRADALTATSRGTVRYADPARRDDTGRRITSTSTIPSVADLDRVDPSAAPVLRLPPGIDYDALARPGEIEIVSLDGVAREAVAWPPRFAEVSRRATVLRSDGGGYQVTSDEPDDASVTAAGDWIVDPDPAVVRAHLVRHYGFRHALSLLDPHLAYLTGPTPPPGIRAFRVRDAAPYRERTVSDWVRRDGVGTLEIKQRGTPVVPDDLRARIRPRGDRRVQRTLIIARVGSHAEAFWCEAVTPAPKT